MDTRWQELLCGFLPNVFPTMANTLGNELSYNWTLWQGEWATDYIFDSPQTLKPLMEGFLRHALLTGTSDRVLRYMNDWVRIRHWVDQNSVKLYNEHNNLRFETTINNPAKFRVYRHQEGQKTTSSKNSCQCANESRISPFALKLPPLLISALSNRWIP